MVIRCLRRKREGRGNISNYPFALLVWQNLNLKWQIDIDESLEMMIKNKKGNVKTVKHVVVFGLVMQTNLFQIFE